MIHSKCVERPQDCCGNQPCTAPRPYIHRRNHVSTGCYVTGNQSPAGYSTPPVPNLQDDGQREFVSLFFPPSSWFPVARGLRWLVPCDRKSHPHAGQQIAVSLDIPSSARSARGSSENEDGKESTRTSKNERCRGSGWPRRLFRREGYKEEGY